MDLNSKVTRLLHSNPDFCKQRRRLLLIFFIRRILVGMQFSVILPTAWKYVKTFHAKPWVFGVVASLYHMGGVFVLPVAGLMFDHYKNSKEMVIFFNFCEMIGNLIYALPFSIWLLVTGRLISGLGSGFLGVMSGEVAWITTKEERLAAFARLELGHLLGLFLGPAISFSVKWVDFKVGNWHIQSTNAPGVLSFVLWLFYQIATIFMARNLAQELSRGYYDKAGGTGVELGEETEENVLLEKEELENNEKQPPSKTEGSHSTAKVSSRKYRFKTLMREMFALETAFVFFSSLLIWIFGATSDVSVTLFTQEDFGWSPGYTSIFYLALGVESFAVFAVIGYFGKRLADENLLMIGLTFSFLSGVASLLYGWQQGHSSTAIPLFCLLYFLGVIGLCTFQIPAKSLLSKIFSPDVQGVVQGFTVISLKFGGTIGPYLGSYLFTHLFITISIFLTLILVCFIWGCFSLEELREKKNLYS